MKVHKHGLFLLAFGSLYLSLCGPLLTMRTGLVKGDYAMQVFPWTLAYAQGLKQGMITLWTPLIQCGFPLFAEGQTGMLYWPNLVLFKFLPFLTAYNLMFLLHFLAGGLFAYLFGSKRGMSAAAATLLSLCFAFGSAGAGGYLNVFSLRVLAFFPLLLMLTEYSREKNARWAFFALALVLGQTWLGGSAQMALYQVLFVALYFVLLEWKNGFDPKRSFLFIFALALSFLIGLPQLWATRELASHASRLLQDPGFVLWGSASPLSAGALVMPALNPLLRCNWYIGILPFLFLLLNPGWKTRRVWWILLVISLAMALGAFNPLYWLWVKLPVLSMLRDPSRFLFFAAFFLSVLAAHAFDDFLADYRQNRRLKRVLYAAMTVFIATVALAFIPGAGRPLLERLGQWYVDIFVMGKSFHRGSPAEYAAKLSGILDWIGATLDPRNPFLWMPALLSAFSACIFYAESKTARSAGTAAAVFLLLLGADLWIYARLMTGTSFVSNIGRFEELLPDPEYPRDGRWLDLGREKLFPPNRSMIGGHAQIGAYSPLLDKDYYQLVKPLGVVDDSFGFDVPDRESFKAAKPLLDFLGVRYASSLDGEIFVNATAQEEFTVDGSSEGILVEKQSDQAALLKVRARSPALLVRNQVFDEGWKAALDGHPAEIERFERAFQAVRVPEGEHVIEFRYRPDPFFKGIWFHAVGMLIGVTGILFFSRRKSA